MAKKNFKSGFDSLLGSSGEKEDKNKESVVGEVVASFMVQKDHLEKIKFIAYWERMKIKDVIQSSMKLFIAEYEKSNGPIDEEKLAKVK